MTNRENITSLDQRIAASQPSRPYPRSVRHHGAWVDGRIIPIRPDHELAQLERVGQDHLDRLGKVKRDDRRALALVFLLGAVIFAVLVVGVLRAP